VVGSDDVGCCGSVSVSAKADMVNADMVNKVNNKPVIIFFIYPPKIKFSFEE
jgi:hypothetical protein